MTNRLTIQHKRLNPTSQGVIGETEVNVKDTLSPNDLARACADAMWKEDDASQGLGMEILEVRAGEAVLAMTIQPHMVNGHGIAHGGFIFLLADFGLRLCLQLAQRAHRRGAVQHLLHPAWQARRPAGRNRPGNLESRPLRDLRCARHGQ